MTHKNCGKDENWLERHALAGLVMMVAITIGCGVMAIWSHYNFHF